MGNILMTRMFGHTLVGKGEGGHMLLQGRILVAIV